MRKRFLSRKDLFLINFLVVAVDQLSKLWAHQFLNNGGIEPFIPFTLQLRLVKNTGAAFSLFSNSTTSLKLFSLLVSILFISWVWRNQLIPFWKGLAIAFLLGGTIGNGIDRWLNGYVIDFFELIPIRFAIFNVADIAINMGIVFLLIDSLSKRNELRAPK